MSVIFILFFIKDYIYLLMDNNIFYPDNIYKEYCILDSDDEYSLNFDYIESRILYRDIYNFDNEITIYKGENYNIKDNMAVVDSSGLVGIVKNVYKTNSEVTLLTNKNTNLSIKVNDEYGLLKYNNSNLIITNLTNNNIEIGDTVYTSGLANTYMNIPIGIILKEDSNTKNITYIVEPFANFDNINYVYILEGVK